MTTSSERIAGYRILRTLGKGGMGTVYLAEQEAPVKRRVALKVLRHAVADDEGSARFLAERHAMGRLDHPNVGRILEAGEDEEGRPFFAMEWLDGLPLDVYCEEKRLSIRERLELFVGICRGVAHAHQKQLLHRDLKPSNVLVVEIDGEPVPKIIDFGVAKALDQPLGGVDLQTQYVLGTPAYTSPEGLRLREVDLDTRSDVYSLGVLLCELLVGRRPHELGDGALGTFLRRKAEEEPTSPSGLVAGLPEGELERIAAARRQGTAELRRTLRGDLDWIVLRAVARRREERYPSVAELAADVERHLRLEPVTARPPSVAYAVRRFVQRHRAAAAVLATLVLAVVIALAGLAEGLRRARDAEARSRADAEAARRAQTQAEAVSAFLSGLLREATPSSSRIGEPTSSAELTARELVERGGARAAEELGEQPDALRRVQSILGDVYHSWGQYEEAKLRYGSALKLLEASDGATPVEEADARISLSQAEKRLQNFDAAEEHLRAALDLVETGDGAAGRSAKLRALVGLAQLARARGEYGDARDLYRRAQELDQIDPAVGTDIRLALYTGLAGVGVSEGRPDLAEAPIRIAYELSRRELPRTHPRRVSVTNYHAVVLAMQGKLAEAHPMFEEAVALRTEVLGRDHPAVAEALNNLGVNLMDLGRSADALPVHREALEIRRQALGDEDLLTAWSHDNLGVALLDLGRPAEALEHHEAALSIRRLALEGDHPLVARSLYFRGRLLERLGRADEAERAYRRSIEIRDAKLPPESAANAEGRVRLGVLLLRRGDGSGEAWVRDGLEVLEAQAQSEPDHETLREMRELAASVSLQPSRTKSHGAPAERKSASTP